MTPKKQPPAFTSFRILGKKAQTLIARAAKQSGAKAAAESKSARTSAKKEEAPELVIHIAPISVLKAALIILAVAVGCWLTVVLRDKLILLLLAFFVAAIIDPGVRYLEQTGFPRGIGILLHYVIVLCILLFLFFSLIPLIASQLQQIAILITQQIDEFLSNPEISLPLLTDEVNQNLTNIAESTLRSLSIDRFADALDQAGRSMSAIAQGSVLVATRIAGSVVNFFVRLVIVLVLAFFIQIEKEHINRWIRSFFPSQQRSYIDTKTDAIHQKIGQWARGQILLGISIGLLVYIALKILGIPYAATLAVLAGFTEFIPYIGPFIAAIPSILIALTEGGMIWAAIVAGVYYVIQWCENNLLVPLIMKRAVGLSPIAIIFAMMAGLSFPTIINPILGMLLAVPAATILALFLEDWRKNRVQKSDE